MLYWSAGLLYRGQYMKVRWSVGAMCMCMYVIIHMCLGCHVYVADFVCVKKWCIGHRAQALRECSYHPIIELTSVYVQMTSIGYMTSVVRLASHFWNDVRLCDMTSVGQVTSVVRLASHLWNDVRLCNMTSDRTGDVPHKNVRPLVIWRAFI